MLHLLTQRNSRFKEVISYKSRPLRDNEVDGVDFHYITPTDFDHQIQADVFLEYAFIHNMYYYGTKRSDIQEALQNGDIVVKEIDIQ
jgi:guanylate kinase